MSLLPPGPMIAAMGRVSVVVLITMVMNVVTLLAFGLDKWRAGRGGRRIPEAHLLLLAFATGFLGAWVGSRLFRHKTRKASFRWKLVGVTLLNPAWALLWLWSRS